MRSYIVKRDDFYNFRNNENFREYFETCKDYVKEPINQIIKRYQIKNKTILSVGSGVGFEEYWFSEKNNLSMIDIDESGALEPHLKDIQKEKEESNSIKYLIGDAMDYEPPTKSDDVYYLHGQPTTYLIVIYKGKKKDL